MMDDSMILLLSGGLDSVTLAYDLTRKGCRLQCLSFDYGQKHLKELTCARFHAESLQLSHTVIELHQIQGLFSHCGLTDGKGGVIVPNRNSVFVHIAASLAVSQGLSSVLIGCNKDDQRDFPDCRWDWVRATNAAFKSAELEVELLAPYTGLTKSQIVSRAQSLGVDLNSVWWCYREGQNPCGKCGSCKKMKGLCG